MEHETCAGASRLKLICFPLPWWIHVSFCFFISLLIHRTYTTQVLVHEPWSMATFAPSSQRPRVTTTRHHQGMKYRMRKGQRQEKKHSVAQPNSIEYSRRGAWLREDLEKAQRRCIFFFWENKEQGYMHPFSFLVEQTQTHVLVGFLLLCKFRKRRR